MDDKKNKKSDGGGENVVKGVYQTYRAEFRKIVWPSRETLVKHTVTVIAVSLIFGAYIMLNDGVMGVLFSAFIDILPDGAGVMPGGIPIDITPDIPFEILPDDMPFEVLPPIEIPIE